MAHMGWRTAFRQAVLRYRTLPVTSPGWIAAIDHAACDLLTCDVFDTLLVRPYAQPTSLFETLAYENAAMLPDGTTAAGWREARIAAERAARAKHYPTEVTLAQIYACLGDALNLPPAVLAQLQAAEIALEQRCLSPVAGLREGLAQWRAGGGKLRFVSDMYLPPETVAGAVVQHGGATDLADVIVSCGSGLSKHAGTLFGPVLQAADCPPSRAFHIGDSFHADVAMPMKSGLTAGLLCDTGLTRYERLARGDCDGDGSVADYVRSATAGSARAARVSRSFAAGHEASVWQVGTGVAGPLVTGFVLWALLQAQAQGLKTLWFLARDGEVMVQLAQCLAQRFGIAVQPVYLYASRQALFLPALDTDAPGAFADAIVQMGSGRSVAQLVWSLEMEQGALGQGDYRPNTAELRQLAAKLWASPAMDKLRETAATRRAATLAYWRAAGLIGPDRVGIVDVGWKGNLQTFMARILHRELGPDAPALNGYYFGLLQQPSANAGATTTFCTPAQIRWPTDLVEIFCAATHGSVRALEIGADGAPAPVLMVEDAEAIAQWGVALQQQAMVAFCQSFCTALPRSGLATAALIEPLRAAGLAAFEGLCFRPTPSEAEAYGSFQFAADPTHSQLAPLAPPPAGLAQMVGLLATPGWWQGSAMRAGSVIGSGLVLASNVKRKLQQKLG